MASPVILQTHLTHFPLLKRGKVRDIYEISDRELLLVATDRLSAFDVVMQEGIPGKGKILTAISRFWFQWMVDSPLGQKPLSLAHHLLPDDPAFFDLFSPEERSMVEERSMRVQRTRVIPFECIVRGYIAGSLWKEYARVRAEYRLGLEGGLHFGDPFPEPVFTPTTKAEHGHDQPVDFNTLKDKLGAQTATALQDISLQLYTQAKTYAYSKGLVVADTKFEFGETDSGLLLIDELLTPDSSRYWLREDYEAGRRSDFYDKQVVRDYLETLSWDKKPPAPSLPESIIQETAQRYQKIYDRLTGSAAETAFPASSS